jgi:hypothetical protein
MRVEVVKEVTLGFGTTAGAYFERVVETQLLDGVQYETDKYRPLAFEIM